MKKYLPLAVLFLVCTGVVFLESLKRPQSQFNKNILVKAEKASLALKHAPYSNKVQNGQVSFVSDLKKITQAQINQYINSNSQSKKRQQYPLNWLDSSQQFATLSAPGIDRQHHFANSYLVGVHPFEVENTWLPLYVLAQRKTYQLDSIQYGLTEVWQNSAQAFKNLRGDCEDHALILADWLISEGIDARVVLGTYKGEGHAWVVAYRKGKVFLLEATDKRAKKSWNHYPLAASAVGYNAIIMFNRTDMWKFSKNNIGTKDYSLSNWQLVSTFQKI